MLEETAIYQVPLFERYPLWTEFDRRQKMIDAAAARDNQIISNHERAQLLGSGLAIDPLVLRPETLTIVHAGQYNEAGELTGYRSTAQIGYFGDPELWNLSPLDLLGALPVGEVIRYELILCHFAPCEAEGERLLNAELDQVRAIIGLQREQVEHFNSLLVSYALTFVSGRERGITARAK